MIKDFTQHNMLCIFFEIRHYILFKVGNDCKAYYKGFLANIKLKNIVILSIVPENRELKKKNGEILK